jgi:hypothetical protein
VGRSSCMERRLLSDPQRYHSWRYVSWHHKVRVLKNLVISKNQLVNQNVKKYCSFYDSYWNPITLVLIWKVLRQAFKWYHFLNPSNFEKSKSYMVPIFYLIISNCLIPFYC